MFGTIPNAGVEVYHIADVRGLATQCVEGLDEAGVGHVWAMNRREVEILLGARVTILGLTSSDATVRLDR